MRRVSSIETGLVEMERRLGLTLTALEACESARDDVADRAGDMHGRALLADREARGDGYGLRGQSKSVPPCVSYSSRGRARTRVRDLMLRVGNER